ncbi:MAG: hypothetical protein U5K31_10110 [Balneolaceae bacterium]|nr:hypothetical protein [Balneolaceae bacterium]
MKRAVTILLLLVLTYQFFGAGFVYNVWLYSVKQQVKENLEREHPDERSLLKLPAAWEEDPPDDLQWHHEKEFRYRGQMYDVIRTERHGDQIWYYVHHDRAETRLLGGLARYVNDFLNQRPDKQRQNVLLESILKQQFLVAGNLRDTGR